MPALATAYYRRPGRQVRGFAYSQYLANGYDSRARLFGGAEHPDDLPTSLRSGPPCIRGEFVGLCNAIRQVSQPPQPGNDPSAALRGGDLGSLPRQFHGPRSDWRPASRIHATSPASRTGANLERNVLGTAPRTMMLGGGGGGLGALSWMLAGVAALAGLGGGGGGGGGRT
jgi:hypothetical protein